MHWQKAYKSLKIRLAFIAVFAMAGAGAQELYDINNLTTIELFFTASNWNQILDNYYANGQDQRLIGACVLNGTVFDSVGVKFKGNSTYNAGNGKNPLNIRLDYIKDQKYRGYKTLKLANLKNDPSSVREVLSYEIARKYTDAPLSNYAQVYVNGTYYGLFCSSESIGSDYQCRKLNANKGNTRFKCNPQDNFVGNGSSLEYLGPDSSTYYTFYELKSASGWQDLLTLITTIKNNPANLDSSLDIDRAIWMMAFNNVLVNLDSYTGPFRQNYYLVRDANNRMVPVIWDLNECLGGFEMVNVGPPTSYDSLKYMNPLIRKGDSTWPLLNLILSDTTWQKMYIAHCRTILNENFANNWYSERADTLQALISAAYNSDPNAFSSYNDFIANLDTTVGTFPLSTVGIRELMEARTNFLQNHPDFQFTPPSISNIAAVPSVANPNTTVYITADISGASDVFLGYRHGASRIFSKTQMFDDGLHNDGVAGDGVYGAGITTSKTDLQYYIYAENNNAGVFAPERAEHEFYILSVNKDVVINELNAANHSIALDEYGESSDWIELHNNTNNAMALDGYYLTNDVTDLTMWPFPSATSIDANGYLIVWADSEMYQGALHANFLLSSSGDHIFLVDSSLTLADEVYYGTQSADWSYGRYPNGTGPFGIMYPTFSMKNTFFLGSEETPAIPGDDLEVFPNPASSRVTIKSTSPDEVPLQIFDMTGQIVYSGMISGNAAIDLKGWHPGLYIVIAGTHTARKLVVY